MGECVSQQNATHTCDSFLCGIGLDQRRFESVPRAVVSEAPEASNLEKARSPSLAELTRIEK